MRYWRVAWNDRILFLCRTSKYEIAETCATLANHRSLLSELFREQTSRLTVQRSADWNAIESREKATGDLPISSNIIINKMVWRPTRLIRVLTHPPVCLLHLSCTSVKKKVDYPAGSQVIVGVKPTNGLSGLIPKPKTARWGAFVGNERRRSLLGLP